MRTPASLFFLFVIASTRFVLAEEDELTKFFNSRDGRFALKINVPKESADAKLEQAYVNREDSIAGIKSDPFLTLLHGDPRFEALVQRVLSQKPQ